MYNFMSFCQFSVSAGTFLFVCIDPMLNAKLFLNGLKCPFSSARQMGFHEKCVHQRNHSLRLLLYVFGKSFCSGKVVSISCSKQGSIRVLTSTTESTATNLPINKKPVSILSQLTITFFTFSRYTLNISQLDTLKKKLKS